MGDGTDDVVDSGLSGWVVQCCLVLEVDVSRGWSFWFRRLPFLVFLSAMVTEAPVVCMAPGLQTTLKLKHKNT